MATRPTADRSASKTAGADGAAPGAIDQPYPDDDRNPCHAIQTPTWQFPQEDPLTGIADRLSDGRHTPISAEGSRRITDLLIGPTAFTPGGILASGAAHLMSPIAGRRAGAPMSPPSVVGPHPGNWSIDRTGNLNLTY